MDELKDFLRRCIEGGDATFKCLEAYDGMEVGDIMASLCTVVTVVCEEGDINPESFIEDMADLIKARHKLKAS